MKKKKISLSKAIHPAKMNEVEKNNLLEQLYKIHCQIFDGVDKEAFRRYVVDAPSKLSRIYLIRNTAGQNVGYQTMHVYEADTGKRSKPLVLRTELGLLPEYRGSHKPFFRLFLDIAGYLIPRGIPESYFLATPINPLAYYVADRLIGEMYPRPGQEVPQKITNLMAELSEGLRLKPAGSGNFVKYVGWETRFSPVELRRLRMCKNAAIRFYMEQNPDFVKGSGMMMIAPANLRNAFFTLKRFVGRSWRRISGGLPRVKSLSLRLAASK